MISIYKVILAIYLIFMIMLCMSEQANNTAYADSYDLCKLKADWLNCNILRENILIPQNKCCDDNYFLIALDSMNLPINIEEYPLKNKLYNYNVTKYTQNINLENIIKSATDIEPVNIIPEIFSKWKLFNTSDVIIGASKVIEAYLDNVNNYEIIEMYSQIVISPNEEDSHGKRMKYSAINLPQATISDLLNAYDSFFKENNIYFMIMVRSNDSFYKSLRFDFDFEGGNLIKLLCKIVQNLNMIDPSHVYTWHMSGVEGHNMAVTFKQIKRMEIRFYECKHY